MVEPWGYFGTSMSSTLMIPTLTRTYKSNV
nr:MAG TPA_asm: hypothetical protein [Bacteriophage sp.]